MVFFNTIKEDLAHAIKSIDMQQRRIIFKQNDQLWTLEGHINLNTDTMYSVADLSFSR